jgi:hypothetical protein
MRYADQKVMMTLGLVALSATVVLLFRLGVKARNRRVVRKDAVEKLQTSGEFFFGTASDVPQS